MDRGGSSGTASLTWNDRIRSSRGHLLPPHGEAEWKKLIGYTAPEDPYLVVADAGGHVHWQGYGAPTDQKYFEAGSHHNFKEPTMIVVTGATGRTGRGVTEVLLAKGEKVRAVGRDARKLAPLVGLGAEPFVGTVEDVSFLTAAFSGATGAYLVLPEDLSQPDLRAHQERVSDCYAAAIANAQVRFAVNLSSIGTQHAKGTGLIVGLHNQEQKLNKVAGLNVLHLRAAYFMENLFMSMVPLRATGTMPGGMRGDVPCLG